MPKFYKDLTPKEEEVYYKIVNNVEGKTVKEMAKEMGISNYTFSTHILHIFEKTGANSQIELIVKYYRERLWKQSEQETLST